MESGNSLWWLILFIPLLVVGVVLGFFPHKVIQIRSKLQHNMFKSFRLRDEDIDHSPVFSTLYGKDYSKRLKSEQERPEEHRFLMIWSRIMGFTILFFTCISIWLLIIAYRSGNLIIH